MRITNNIKEVRQGIPSDNFIAGDMNMIRVDIGEDMFIDQDSDCIRVHPAQLPELNRLVNLATVLAGGQKLYTCKGKGGRYLLLGEATGAGTSRDEGKDIVIYQDVYSGELFKRTVGDFHTRMEKIDD